MFKSGRGSASTIAAVNTLREMNRSTHEAPCGFDQQRQIGVRWRPQPQRGLRLSRVDRRSRGTRGVRVERRCRNADLLGQERHEVIRCACLQAKAEPGMLEQGQLDREAEPVRVATPHADQSEVPQAQHVVTCEILAGDGHVEQHLALGIGQQVASCHEVRPQKGEKNCGHTAYLGRSLWTVLGYAARLCRRRPQTERLGDGD